MASIPLPILFYFTTHQITYRKISPAVIILLIYTLIIIFQNKKIKKVSNILLSIFLVVLHITFFTNIIFSNEKTIRWSNQEKTFLEKIVLGYQFPKPINSGNYRYDKLIDFIEKEKNKSNFNKITLVIKDHEFPIERYLLQIPTK